MSYEILRHDQSLYTCPKQSPTAVVIVLHPPSKLLFNRYDEFLIYWTEIWSYLIRRVQLYLTGSWHEWVTTSNLSRFKNLDLHFSVIVFLQCFQCFTFHISECLLSPFTLVIVCVIISSLPIDKASCNICLLCFTAWAEYAQLIEIQMTYCHVDLSLLDSFTPLPTNMNCPVVSWRMIVINMNIPFRMDSYTIKVEYSNFGFHHRCDWLSITSKWRMQAMECYLWRISSLACNNLQPSWKYLATAYFWHSS